MIKLIAMLIAYRYAIKEQKHFHSQIAETPGQFFKWNYNSMYQTLMEPILSHKAIINSYNDRWERNKKEIEQLRQALSELGGPKYFNEWLKEKGE